MLSEHNTPNLRPTPLGLTPPLNGQASNQMKRSLSQDEEGSMDGEVEEVDGRRSKRVKKGNQNTANTSSDLRMADETIDAAPTVAGSHMNQPRQSTPGRTFYQRARAVDERPGDVSITLYSALSLY